MKSRKVARPSCCGLDGSEPISSFAISKRSCCPHLHGIDKRDIWHLHRLRIRYTVSMVPQSLNCYAYFCADAADHFIRSRVYTYHDNLCISSHEPWRPFRPSSDEIHAQARVRVSSRKQDAVIRSSGSDWLGADLAVLTTKSHLTPVLSEHSRLIYLETQQTQHISSSHLYSHAVSRSGTVTKRYFTIASGPLSTCRPVGIACVLISGTTFLAIACICSAS